MINRRQNQKKVLSRLKYALIYYKNLLCVQIVLKLYHESWTHFLILSSQGCIVNCPIKLNCIIVDLLSNVLILFIFSSFPSTIFFPSIAQQPIYKQSMYSIFVITQLSYLSFNYAACKKDTDVGKKMKRFCLENFQVLISHYHSYLPLKDEDTYKQIIIIIEICEAVTHLWSVSELGNRQSRDKRDSSQSKNVYAIFILSNFLYLHP